MMKNFHDELLPKEVSIYLSGGPEFYTDLIKTISGQEIRNSCSAEFVKVFEMKNCFLSEEIFTKLYNFFVARCGRKYGFKIYDIGNHSLSNAKLLHYFDNVFKIVQSFGDVSRILYKRIYCPIISTIKLRNASGELIDSYDFDKNNCTIMMHDSITSDIYIDTEFYSVVRFDSDRLNYYKADNGSFCITGLDLVEVLLDE